MNKPYIVGHTSPDWDCIGAVWLLKRFTDLESADVVFVNTGSPDPAILATAAAVVDTGRVLDPIRLRFDHHQLPGTEANTCCATSLVFQWLRQDNESLEAIGPLVNLIYAGDTGQWRYGADWSRHVGIHALLSAQKARRIGDEALLAFGFDMLDLLAEHSQARYAAQDALDKHTVYRSQDGLVVALRDAPPFATSAAHEAGARLVLFQSSSEGTNAIGIMRGGEAQEPSCKALILSILNDAECDAPGSIRWDSAEYIEMARWYLHEAGFFAGRGTAKAPDPRPIDADLVELAKVIDRAWATPPRRDGGAQ